MISSMQELDTLRQRVFDLWRAYNIQGGHDLTEEILVEMLNLIAVILTMPPDWLKNAKNPTERV